MAGHRKPRPTGLDEVDPIDEGTSCRSLSHPPGPIGVLRTHGSSGYGHKSSNQRFHATLLVKHGDRGPAVRALQSLLNLHLQPRPNLRIDGYFGTETLTALKRFQTAQNLRDDGVAGHATWYRLTYTNPPKAPRIVQPNGQVDVSAWPMPKRIAEVIRLLPGKLPHELWNQLRGLMSTDMMVIAVALYAASHLFGAGEVIDIGIALIVAEQGVIELAECVQITVLAMSPMDLDEAATHLARAISIITVFKFATLLARFLKNRPVGETPEKPGVQDEPAPPPATRAPAVRKLFRAVDTTELESIRQSKAFTPSPNGTYAKGFFFEKADAQDFASRMTDMTGTTHTVVEAEAPGSLVSSSLPHSAATEGPGVYITNENLSVVKLKQ